MSVTLLCITQISADVASAALDNIWCCRGLTGAAFGGAVVRPSLVLGLTCLLVFGFSLPCLTA